MSQVVTLYKDKEKTDALYPRTKVSAISDDNNTSLQELLNRYEIIDNLTSYNTDKALSANQGRELNDNFKNYYDKTEVNDLLDNIDVTGMVKQEEGGTEEEVVTPTNADTLGGKLTANNVVFYEEEITNEVGQMVLRNADLLDNHPASYFATSEDLNVVSEELNTAIANSGKFYGIDTSNVIATWNEYVAGSAISYEWTAPEDCFFIITRLESNKGNNNPAIIKIDDFTIFNGYYDGNPNRFVFSFKKGTKIYVYGRWYFNAFAFGIKG